MQSLPENYFEKSLAYTQKTYTNEYPAIDPTTPALSQEGKIVIITGASRGLGQRAFAKQFARANAKALVLVATNAARLAETEKFVRQFNSQIELLSVAADISKEEDVKTIFSKTQERFGRHADVLVNNAGINNNEVTIKDADPKTWWHDFEVNIFGYFLITKYFLQQLPEGHGPATLILLTSWAGLLPGPTASAYTMTKHAAIQLAQIAASENPNVAAFALHPGIVPTDMLMDSYARFARDHADLPGGTAVWLASESARPFTGRVINSNWDVAELLTRKDEILKNDDLKPGFKGKLGQQ